MNNQNGFSLVEILLVLSVFGLLIILLSAFPNSVNLITWSRHQSLAREIAVKEIERIREQPYSNLAEGTQSLNDSRIDFLPQGSGETKIEPCDSTICTQSELVKKITVKINWTQLSENKQVLLTTFVSEGGLNQ